MPGGITSPGATGSVKEVYLESHRYSVVTLDEVRAPVLRSTLNLEFALEET